MSTKTPKRIKRELKFLQEFVANINILPLFYIWCFPLPPLFYLHCPLYHRNISNIKTTLFWFCWNFRNLKNESFHLNTPLPFLRVIH